VLFRSAHQFKKGTSGNPAGAPAKPKRKSIDVAAVLTEPIAVKKAGVRRQMQPYEAGVRKLVERALKRKNLAANLEFIGLCEKHRLLVPLPVDHGGGVITAPAGVNFEEWFESATELVLESLLDDDDTL